MRGSAAWAPLIFSRQGEIATFAPLEDWLLLLAIGLPLIFVQCAAEEMLFRGYLLQQFAACLKQTSVIGECTVRTVLQDSDQRTVGQADVVPGNRCLI